MYFKGSSIFNLLFCGLCLFIGVQNVAADGNTFKVCSQNIYRLGEKGSFKDNQFQSQLSWLVKRIVNADCSIVALQEVPSKGNKVSTQILEILANNIKGRNGKTFEIVLSNSNDSYIRNAFLVSTDFSIVKSENWNHDSLPKLDIRSAPWSYARGPLALWLKAKKINSDFEIFIVTDHLKSKSKGWKDPNGSQYELSRVLSAASIKRKFLENKSVKTLEIYLGDRNAGPSGASSQVLQGRVSFDDFKRGGHCEISSEGSALCSPGAYDVPDMVPVLETLAAKTNRDLGTFKMGRKEEILDEIYVFKDDEKLIQDKVGRIKAGVEGEFRKGSDHLLSWVEISLPN